MNVVQRADYTDCRTVVGFCASTRRDERRLLPAGEDHGGGKGGDGREEVGRSVATLLDQELAGRPIVSLVDLRRTDSSTHSRMTSADMASTIGMARGTTHGSWRPRAASDPAAPLY